MTWLLISSTDAKPLDSLNQVITVSHVRSRDVNYHKEEPGSITRFPATTIHHYVVGVATVCLTPPTMLLHMWVW